MPIHHNINYDTMDYGNQGNIGFHGNSTILLPDSLAVLRPLLEDMASKNLSISLENLTAFNLGRYGHIGHQQRSHDDATWILTSAFIIFTMQSG